MVFPVFLDLFAGFITTFLEAVGGLIFLYIVLMLAPLIVQLVMTILINTIQSALRFNIRPVLELVLLPGSILRMNIVWFILSMMGFDANLAFRFPRFGDPASNVTGKYNYPGLIPYAYLNRKAADILYSKFSPIRIAFIVSLASYAIMPIVLLMIIFSQQIVFTMYFILPAHVVLPIFYYTVTSLFLGGMPVPEETMSVFYVSILNKPYMFTSILTLILSLLILGAYLGVAITVILGALVFVVNFYIDRVFQEADKEDPETLRERLISMFQSIDDV